MLADFDVFAKASCKGATWWPWPSRTRPDDETWQLAIDCCGTCRVRRSCARLALAQSPRPDGVWGGVLLGDNGRGVEALRAVARGERVTITLPVQLRLGLG